MVLQTLCMALELPAGRTECARDRHERILCARSRDGEVTAGKAQIDADRELVALAMMKVRLLDDDRAALDASIRVLEPADPVVDRGLDGHARRHSSERDVERSLHVGDAVQPAGQA